MVFCAFLLQGTPIYMEYDLKYPKLTTTVTDNGSNLVKAYQIFGVHTFTEDSDENNSNSQ